MKVVEVVDDVVVVVVVVVLDHVVDVIVDDVVELVVDVVGCCVVVPLFFFKNYNFKCNLPIGSF